MSDNSQRSSPGAEANGLQEGTVGEASKAAEHECQPVIWGQPKAKHKKDAADVAHGDKVLHHHQMQGQGLENALLPALRFEYIVSCLQCPLLVYEASTEEPPQTTQRVEMLSPLGPRQCTVEPTLRPYLSLMLPQIIELVNCAAQKDAACIAEGKLHGTEGGPAVAMLV